MIHHIALTVNTLAEVKYFYEKVLLFTIHHQFELEAALSKTIFNIDSKAEVIVMRLGGLELELFISERQEKNAYSHVCFAFCDSKLIYNRAQKAGYRTFVKPRNGYDTYFIWDESGNTFEIKELEKDAARNK